MNTKLLTIGILILLNMAVGQASAATSYCGDIVVWEETDLSAVKEGPYTRINGIVVNFEDVCRQLHVSGRGNLKIDTSVGGYDFANFHVKVYKDGGPYYLESSRNI